MIVGEDLNNERLYEESHVAEVLWDIYKGSEDYFSEFAGNGLASRKEFEEAFEEFERELPKYKHLLKPDALEEYAYDPNSFKGTLRSDCPIIRRCLNSPAKVMDAYRSAFNQTDGSVMRNVIHNIVSFANEYASTFDNSQFESVDAPEQLGLSDLDAEPYTAPGVIGGGIRSHFLFYLYPGIFPNRSQNAVWALYFLTGRKDYGFEDNSEFLMVDPDGSGTQQNYFYPYDLFTFYAIHLYEFLQEFSEQFSYTYDDNCRFLYVDAFLDHIADKHRKDINYLKPPHERFNY